MQALLPVELEHRFGNGEGPTVQEFQARFPDEKELVTRIYDLSSDLTTAHNQAAEQDTSMTPATSDSFHEPVDLGSIQLGEYQTIRTLGMGAFGVVYEAEHVVHGNRVALKVLKQIDPRRQQETGDRPS